jgi:1-acyl-sn-glycerol-3-phosphate acyltransferase
VRKLLRLLQIAGVGFCFLYFWTGGFLVANVYVPWLQLRENDPKKIRDRVQSIIKASFRQFCDLLRGLHLIDIDPRRYAADTPGSAYVLIANHPTLIDVIALIASYDRLCVVVKRSVYRGINVGRMLRAAGYIDGGGSDGSVKASLVLDQAIDRLKAGYGVLIFPEGTRSPPNEMHPFMRSPFEMASRAGAPLLPVFIQCQPPALMKGVPWYRFPNAFVDYQLKALAPMAVGTGRTSVRTAMKEVRDLLLSKVRATQPAQT